MELWEPRLTAAALVDRPPVRMASLLLLVWLDRLPLQTSTPVGGLLPRPRELHWLGLRVLVPRTARGVTLPTWRLSVPLLWLPLRLALWVRSTVYQVEPQEEEPQRVHQELPQVPPVTPLLLLRQRLDVEAESEALVVEQRCRLGAVLARLRVAIYL